MKSSKKKLWLKGIKEARNLERERIIEILDENLGNMDWDTLVKLIRGGKLSNKPKYSSETVTIKISKNLIDDKPSHWSAEITDIDGEYLGGAMAPTFSLTMDSVYELITGDDGEFESVHNKWVDFDANTEDIRPKGKHRRD